jgi:hypothetical protein
MTGLWLGIFLAFAAVTDYTVSKSNIQMNWKPDVRMETTVIYYDVFEFGEDGMRTITKDSIVYYDRVRKRNK